MENAIEIQHLSTIHTAMHAVQPQSDNIMSLGTNSFCDCITCLYLLLEVDSSGLLLQIKGKAKTNAAAQ